MHKVEEAENAGPDLRESESVWMWALVLVRGRESEEGGVKEGEVEKERG